MRYSYTVPGWLKIITIPVLVVQILYSEPVRTIRSTNVPFVFDYTVFKSIPSDSQGLSRLSGRSQSVVDLYVFIIKNQLIYVRHGDGFMARFMVEVFLSDKTGAITLSKSYSDSIIVYSYKSTLSDGSPYVVMFEFTVPPGEYNVNLNLYDYVSKRSKTYQTSIIVRSFDECEIQLSGIVLRYPFVTFPKEGDLGEELKPWMCSVPNPTKQFGPYLNLNKVGVYFEVYGLHTELARSLLVEIKILSIRSQKKILSRDKENYKVISSFLRSVPITEKNLTISLDFSTDNLLPGKYFITINVWQKGLNNSLEQSTMFTVYQSPLSLKFKTFSDALDEIRYLTTKKEMKQLKNTPFSMQQKALLDFWASRDPTPGTLVNELMIEYYQRLEIANESFNKGLKAGWKTDRGRIFVLFGIPDEVINRDVISNPEISGWRRALASFEVWKYHNIGKNFIFIDKLGFGDYSLANPNGNDFIPVMF